VLEVGANLEKALDGGGFSTAGRSTQDSVVRYRLRSLQAAAYHAEGRSCLLVMDEADTLMNLGEKGLINQLMDRIRTPVVWIANQLPQVERSTLRRFDYALSFRKLNEAQRRKLWVRILEKHGAADLLSVEALEGLARRHPAAAGSIELAVRNALDLKAGGSPLTPLRILEGVLRSQGKLLRFEEDGAFKTVRAPFYTLEGLNLKGDVQAILRSALAFNSRWKDSHHANGPCNLTLLLYGAPGTGKTEFARYLARELDRPLLSRKASDLLDMFVGGTEKNLREAFADARDQGAVLLLDEADSFLQSRAEARNSWEVTQVNELLTHMDGFTGMLICCTNFEGHLDPASRRRFHLKLEFGYLKGNGARHFWRVFFAGRTAYEPDEEFFLELCALPLLAPGDFKAVYERTRYFESEDRTPEALLEELKNEISFKDARAGRRLGLQ
jgi:hypothetical protein